MAPETALLFVILSPVSAYYKTGSDGAVSIYADPNVVRAFPGGVGNRKVGSNYGPTIGEFFFIMSIIVFFFKNIVVLYPATGKNMPTNEK